MGLELLARVRELLRAVRRAYRTLLEEIPEEYRHKARPEKTPGIPFGLASAIEEARLDRLVCKRDYVHVRRARDEQDESALRRLERQLSSPVRF